MESVGNVVALMQEDPYAFQSLYPELPEPVAMAMRGPDWGHMLAGWPRGENITGPSRRDLNRIGRLIAALKRTSVNTSVLMAPQRFNCTPEIERTKF